jgi:hypothetical protein
MENLELIFSKRFGGSVNIRGISFQIRYSILKSFELLEEKATTLTLEGIEDIDLKGMLIDSNVFIQVKTSSREWKWSQLKDPLKNFLEVFAVNSNAEFILVLNCPFKGNVAKLSKYKILEPNERIYIQDRIVELLKDSTKLSKQILINFLDNLSIVYIDEDKLNNLIYNKITDNLGIATGAVSIYASLLIARFLEWAEKRKSVTKFDIINFVAESKENLAVEEQFQAIGNSLISKVSWETNNYVNDYYEGKNTHPSHISAGADYKRLKWLDIIDTAVKSNKLCLVKESSGQGKSTLLYRYAHDYWLHENIYKINSIRTQEQVELLFKFLSHRVKLDLPILVLIDNINFKVQLWSDLVIACSGININFLVTIRKEDWFRYGKENLEYEVIEPFLDLNEAKEIFSLFKKNGKISSNIDSAEIAFERIGSVKLLMEYVYLITQGVMLKDRLQDQIRQIHIDEDPIKIDILRKVALSNIFEAPLLMDKLIHSIKFKGDPQVTLHSLNGEYLKIENNLLFGLHWVRTEHLYNILFENYIDPSNIALEIFDFIPPDVIKEFVSGVLSSEDMDKDSFENGILQNLNNLSPEVIVLIVEGFFIAGEKNFFLTNKNVFDDANDLLGYIGPWFLYLDLLIHSKNDNTLDFLIETLGEDKGSNYIELKNLFEKIIFCDRGKDFCVTFLCRLLPDLEVEKFIEDYPSSSKLLDWIVFCGIYFSGKDEIEKFLFKGLNNFQSLPLEDLKLAVQTLFKSNKILLLEWYNHLSDEIIGFLKYKSDSVYLEIIDNKISFKFIAGLKTDISVHEETIERIELFEDLLPFVDSINSEGLYYVPIYMTPSNDESRKNIKQKISYPILDVQRNRVLLEIVQEKYFTNSYYTYQNNLYYLRIDISKFFKEFSSILVKSIKGIRFNTQTSFENGKLPTKIIDSITKFPQLPQQTPRSIKKDFDKLINDWSVSIRSFIIQIFEHMNDSSKDSSLNMALFNLKTSIEKLTYIHSSINGLFNVSPEYFPFSELSNEEIKIYSTFYDLIELKFKYNPGNKIVNPLSYIRSKKNAELKSKIGLIKDQFISEYEKYVFSETIVEKEGLTFYSIMFEVNDLRSLINDLLSLIIELFPVKDIVYFYCLIPIKNKKRVIDGYYFISSTTIEKINSGEEPNWESLAPVDINKEIVQGIPEYDIEITDDDKLFRMLSGLRISLESISNLKNIVELYLDPNNKYDQKLIESYESQIKKMITETKQILNEIYHINNNESMLDVINDLNNKEFIANIGKWIKVIEEL